MTFFHKSVVEIRSLAECSCCSFPCNETGWSGLKIFTENLDQKIWPPSIFIVWKITFCLISPFLFHGESTFIQLLKDMKVTKWWQNGHFLVNYPFNKGKANEIKTLHHSTQYAGLFKKECYHLSICVCSCVQVGKNASEREKVQT